MYFRTYESYDIMRLKVNEQKKLDGFVGFAKHEVDRLLGARTAVA